MSIRLFTIALALISIYMIACGRKTSENSESTEMKGSMAKAVKLADDMYPEASVWPNFKNDYAYALSTQKATPKSLLKQVHFFVYSAKMDTIIHRDILPLGKIKWTDTYQLRVEKYPGETDPSIKPDMGYVLDVLNREKSEI